MEDLFKNDGFAQFIITEYLTDSDLTDEEKIEQASSSIEEFSMALEAFKMQAAAINKR